MEQQFQSPIGASVQAIIFDCKDPQALARFYAQILGGTVSADPYGGWSLTALGLNMELGFQRDEYYTPPVWLGEVGDAQPMLHIDIRVNNREQAVEYALSLGATLPKQLCQPEWPVQWTTLLDPAGHPFCLFDE